MGPAAGIGLHGLEDAGVLHPAAQPQGGQQSPGPPLGGPPGLGENGKLKGVSPGIWFWTPSWCSPRRPGRPPPMPQRGKWGPERLPGRPALRRSCLRLPQNRVVPPAGAEVEELEEHLDGGGRRRGHTDVQQSDTGEQADENTAGTRTRKVDAKLLNRVKPVRPQPL